MYKVNDFFCGAGGIGLGFKNAGYILEGSWDFDKYAVESYKHNVSDKVKQADITQMNYKDVPKADVWTFGFPCQDISVAGKQAGMIKGETRSGLFYEIMRLLEETGTNNKDNLPKIILAENVKGVRKFLPTIEEEYKKRGYKLFTTLYNSKYFGVPQNRERYFILGVHESIENEFVFKEQQTNFVPKLSSVLENNVEEKYFISDEKAKNVIEQAKQRTELSDIHACITPSRLEKRQNGRRAKDNEEAFFTLTSQDVHGVIQKVGNINPSEKGMNGNVYHVEGVSPTLTTNKGEGIKVIGMIGETGYESSRRVHDVEGVSPTIRAHSDTVKILTKRYRVRRITPRECARLQGFPETFEFHVSNAQLYKQFGNAVTVNVAHSIALQISEFLKDLESESVTDEQQ